MDFIKKEGAFMGQYKKRADGRYCTTVQLGVDPATGKKIKKTIYAKSIKELQRKVVDTNIQIQNNVLIKSPDILFMDYAKSWFSTYKSIKSINTKAMYSNVIEKHLQSIDYIPINKIVNSDIQNIINEKSNKAETCKKIILTLRQIFSQAIQDGLIVKNPTINVTLPEQRKSSKRALLDIEKKAILKADFSPMQEAYIYLLYYCGLRREEALALTKSDIKNDTVSINKALIFDKNTPVLSDTKNASSYRTVPIPADAKDIIKKYAKSCSTIYLFTKQDGTLITKSAYTKFWNSIIKVMNCAIMSENQIKAIDKLPNDLKSKNRPICELTAHIFRHNYATMLYYSGISLKKAAALLGHSDTKMIMQVYAHLDEAKENVEGKLDENIKIS